MTRSRIDWRDDRGQVAGVEALPFGVLLFVVGALLIANAWAVIDAKMTVTSAAREAARSYVEGSSPEDARARAESAARDAVRAHGRNSKRMTIDGPDSTEAFSRCNRITFAVSYPVPALTLPFIGGFGHAFDVTATHSELVDPFRNDVPGEAVCG
jgi:Flp pilus assembly protein TadG